MARPAASVLAGWNLEQYRLLKAAIDTVLQKRSRPCLRDLHHLPLGEELSGYDVQARFDGVRVAYPRHLPEIGYELRQDYRKAGYRVRPPYFRWLPRNRSVLHILWSW